MHCSQLVLSMDEEIHVYCYRQSPKKIWTFPEKTSLKRHRGCPFIWNDDWCPYWEIDVDSDLIMRTYLPLMMVIIQMRRTFQTYNLFQICLKFWRLWFILIVPWIQLSVVLLSQRLWRAIIRTISVIIKSFLTSFFGLSHLLTEMGFQDIQLYLVVVP